MLLLYNILITLLWPVLAFYPPFRGTLQLRLGKFRLADYDPAQKHLKVLINAVSAGEVVAISSFIRQLRLFSPGVQIVLMTTTKSGQEMAQAKLADSLDGLLYFPLIDLPFVVKRYLDRLKPDLYITTESELWPNIHSQCRSRSIPVALVNARIYLHNKSGLRGKVVRSLYQKVNLVVCQDEEQHRRFLGFGLPESVLRVSGNIKFDFDLGEWTPDQNRSWARKWGVEGAKVVVAGSTHPGEESLLLNAIGPAISAGEGKLKLVMAPRHIDRAAEVVELAAGAGLSTVLMSNATDANGNYDVLVVDSYGVLVDMYRLADVVVMGGTFDPKVGGHNLLEATALGKPVVIGPHVFSIENQLELFRGDDAYLQVDSDDGPRLTADLRNLIESTLADPEKAQTIGSSAKAVTEANRGSAARAVEQVLSLVQ